VQRTVQDYGNSVAVSSHTNKKNSNDCSAYVECCTLLAEQDTFDESDSGRSFAAIIKNYIIPFSTCGIVGLRAAILKNEMVERALPLAPLFQCQRG
jgi:hypothetical protein